MGDLILAAMGQPYTGSYLADFVGGFWDNYYQYSNAVYGIRTGSFGLYAQDTFKVTVESHAELRASLRLLRAAVRYSQRDSGPFSRAHNPPCFPTLLREFSIRAIPARPIARSSIQTTITLLHASDSPGTCSATRKIVMRGGFGIFYDIEDGALNLQFGGCASLRRRCQQYNMFQASLASGRETRSPIRYGPSALPTCFHFCLRGKWEPSEIPQFRMPTQPTRTSERHIQKTLTLASSGRRPAT